MLKSIHEFGPIKGPYIMSQTWRKNRNIRIQLPGYRAPIFLRTEPADITVFDKIFIQREYDIPVQIEDPKIIIDGGANIGFATVFFANKYPKARIIAVEPEESNYQLLLQNTQSYHNVTAIRAAIWKDKTPLNFTNTQHGNMAFQVRETDSASGSIPAVTLLDLLELAGSESIDILKLDIECAEKDIFEADCKPWLDKVKVILIELHDWIRAGNSTAFYRAICQYEFRQFLNGENVIVVKP
jgi:FkbM family methyltransferase